MPLQPKIYQKYIKSARIFLSENHTFSLGLNFLNIMLEIKYCQVMPLKMYTEKKFKSEKMLKFPQFCNF